MAKQNKSNKQNRIELSKLLLLFPILPLIFAAFAINGPYESKEFMHIPQIDIPGEIPSTMGFDFSPMLHFSSNTQHAEIVAVLTAVASDSGDNKGIEWIKIYENGNLINKKTCDNNPSVCTFSKTITKDFPGTYNYYAKTMDLGENIIQSDTITIVFDGLNHPPQIYNFTPQETELEINVSDSIYFEVWASDPDDDSITYIWTIDSNEVSTTSSWNYQPIVDDAGAVHEVVVSVSDGEHDSTQTWNVEVLKVPTTCSLSFAPESPINYAQQPFTASCSCTNPEANAELWRNNQDVSTENGQPATLAANPAGYNYICNVSETDHYLGTSASDTYIINQADSEVNLLLNGQDNDFTIIVGDSVEMNGILIMPTKMNPNPNPYEDDTIDDIVFMSIIPIRPIRQPHSSKQSKQGPYHIELLLDGQLVDSGDYNVSYTTSFDNAGIHNVTVVYSENENYTSSFETHFITVEEDTEAPVVNLISPVDGFVFNVSDVMITYATTDNLDSMLTCNIWSNTNGAWGVDAQQQTASGSSNNWTYSNLPIGFYVWNIECQDDSGNSAFAPANWRFTVNADVEAPIIKFVSPTPENNSAIATNWTIINTTITDDTAVANAILEWNGVNETMSGSGTNYYVNKTDLADGIYSYRVYANDTLNNWNVSETRILTVDTTIQIHDIAVESLTLLKDVDGINKTIESTTAYLNDSVYVLALVHNLGNVNETVNIILQNNIGIIDTQIIELDAGQSKIASFVWNAYPEGWHTVEVNAEPVQGETDLTNNELSEDVLVWEVCNVIDCSIFGPKTASESYPQGKPFLVRSMIQNLWNNETFKDLRIELAVKSPGLQITAPWPAVQYIDLNPSQFAVANWNVTSINTGTFTLTEWAGNREYNKIKEITIE